MSRWSGVVLGVALCCFAAACGGHPHPEVSLDGWTRCDPATAGIHEHGWATKPAISRAALNYEYEHRCTFWFTGDSPEMVVDFHDHPNDSD